MNMQEIRKLARDRGLKPGKSTKLRLVREIQRQEGNFDCYATDTEGQCNQSNCLWHRDCAMMASKSLNP
jgi:hypothetical protein